MIVIDNEKGKYIEYDVFSCFCC